MLKNGDSPLFNNDKGTVPIFKLSLSKALLFVCVLNTPAYAVSIDAKSQALAHYIMATSDEINGDDDKAMAEYQASIKFDGQESAPRLKLGAYYLRNDKLDLAIKELKVVARISPNNDLSNTDVYMYLGQLYYAQNNYAQAINQFTKVLSIKHDDTSALFFLGSVWADTKEYAKAIEDFRRVLTLEPKNSEALNSLGYVYAEDDVHLDDAIRMVNQAIEIDPTNGAYYDSLGWAFYKRGNYQEALAALRKAQSFVKDKELDEHIAAVEQKINGLKK